MKFEIFPLSTRRYSFIPDDLRYFQTHFVREPMGNFWDLPPVTPYGKSYKPADFVSWMLYAPIVSERAKAALEDVCSGLVEFLPFHPIKKAKYFALNVLSSDSSAPIYKPEPLSVPLVDERIGAVLRDNSLSGVALADPENCIGRRVVHHENLHDYPGLIG